MKQLTTAAVAILALVALTGPASAATQGTWSLGANFGTGIYSNSDLNDALTADQIKIAGRGHTYYKNSGVIERLDVTLLWHGDQAYDLQAITSQPNSQLVLKDIHAVSDAGWLAGFGWTTNFDPRPVVLMPK